MNSFDSTQRVRLTSGVPGQSAGNGAGSLARRLFSLRAGFRWALILVVSLLMVAGCGRYKEELESAKGKISKLNAQIKELTETVTKLKKEESRLSGETENLSKQNSQMQRELNAVREVRERLGAENKDIKQKNTEAEREIESLKRDNARLTEETESLKKRVIPPSPPPKTSELTPNAKGLENAEQPKEATPCDAVIAFMRASEAAVRKSQPSERVSALDQVKEQYAPKMEGAPEKAVKAAQEWVKQGLEFWVSSKPPDDAMFRLIRLRNTVLEACGKSPKEGGF